MFRLFILGATFILLLTPESLAEAQAMTREQFFSRYGAHLEEGAPASGTGADAGQAEVEHEAAGDTTEGTDPTALSEDTELRGAGEEVEESGSADSSAATEEQEPSRPLTAEERREERLARGRPELGSLPPSSDTALHRSGDLAGTGPPLAAVGITSLLSALGIRGWRRRRRVKVNPELL